ncbi:MAG: ATP-binding cassette domain-containing protein [Candidatus Shapirobacteria bacterium]
MEIVFKGVSKSFGSLEALKDISFRVKAGEFSFLTGTSGAGKTTIFKIITGQIVPDEGEVKVGEWLVFGGQKKISPKELLALRRKVGLIFQDFQLIEEYTVEENVSLALDILCVRGRDCSEQVGKVLEKVGLLSRAKAFPRQLSGGELQRLSLARALSMKPEILLADEPTGNLDPETSWQLIALLDKINKEGTTLLMATHNFDIVDSFEKRVIKLKNGKLVSDKKKGKY